MRHANLPFPFTRLTKWHFVIQEIWKQLKQYIGGYAMEISDTTTVPLGEFPTPLQELANLRKALNGPRIFMKRDDLDGRGLGGNKLRKLEYALAEAQVQRATTIITTGAVQSNHTRLTLAAANKLGMETILILRGKEPRRASGNLLLDKILAARKIYYIEPPSDDPAKATQIVEDKVKEVEEGLRANGETPYYIPNGCKAFHGALGYSGCVSEIIAQLQRQRLAPGFIVTACGTSSTQLGLVLGAALYTQGETKVLGISVSKHRDELEKKIKQNLALVTDILDLKQDIDDESIMVYDNYVGDGYGIPSAAMKEAVKLVAKTEGIILDCVYAGKAMAGLIDLVRNGKFQNDDVVVFLHTGGVPGLFADEQMETFQE